MLFDVGILFLVGHFLEGMGIFPLSVPVFLLRQRQALVFQDSHRHLCDGHAGGQARGVNGCHMDKPRNRFGCLNDKVTVLFGASDTGEGGNDLTEVDAGYAPGGQPAHQSQPLRGGLGGIRRCHHGGCGAGQQVAVRSRGDQNTLALGSGDLENGMLHPAALGLVQQHVLACPGDDGEEAISCHPGHLIRIAAGTVQQPGALHGLPGGGGDGEAVLLLNADNLKVSLQLHAIVHGVADGGNGQVIGADDARIGHIQGFADLFGQVRLHLAGFLSGDQPDAVDAVFKAAVVELFQNCLFFGCAEGDHQRTVVLVMDIQLPGRLIKKANALGIHPGLQGAGFRVISAVNDAGVGTGGTHGNIVLFFQKTHPQIVPAQFSGCHTADHAGTDNGNVIPHE